LKDGDLLLEVRNLCVAYGKVEALHDASIRVRAGEIVTVIGPNGAGKTTLLCAIMGLLPSRGQIVFGGEPQRDLEVEHLVYRGLGLVPEKRELFGAMTVADNLLLGAFQRYRRGRRDHAETMKEVFRRFPRLEERRAQLAGTLSGGERQMLAMGRALMARPRLLMLDEPSLGLAPMVVREIFHIIADLRKSGVAILLVEQNARAALQVADYGYVVETGSVILEGTGPELASDPRVIESYLGLSRSRSGTATAREAPLPDE
jgi:branched-chain amino acid transport system ATP-binding protein